MKLERSDIEKFYYLHTRFNELSSNIGVVANQKEFDKKMKPIIHRIKHIKGAKCYKTSNTLVTFIGNEETTFVRIQDTNDLIGRTFRRFM